MLKLMKYELRKTAFSKLVLLVITAVAEIAFLIGVFWKKDNILAMGIIFLVMCTIFGVIYIGIESVNVLHRDLNTKQSYMLFLTPKSSYQILGAKILENGISIIMAGAFFAALAAIDVTVALHWRSERDDQSGEFLYGSKLVRDFYSGRSSFLFLWSSGKLDRLHCEC